MITEVFNFARSALQHTPRLSSANDRKLINKGSGLTLGSHSKSMQSIIRLFPYRIFSARAGFH